MVVHIDGIVRIDIILMYSRRSSSEARQFRNTYDNKVAITFLDYLLTATSSGE